MKEKIRKSENQKIRKLRIKEKRKKEKKGGGEGAGGQTNQDGVHCPLQNPRLFVTQFKIV